MIKIRHFSGCGEYWEGKPQNCSVSRSVQNVRVHEFPTQCEPSLSPGHRAIPDQSLVRGATESASFLALEAKTLPLASRQSSYDQKMESRSEPSGNMRARASITFS